MKSASAGPSLLCPALSENMRPGAVAVICDHEAQAGKEVKEPPNQPRDLQDHLLRK